MGAYSGSVHGCKKDKHSCPGGNRNAPASTSVERADRISDVKCNFFLDSTFIKLTFKMIHCVKC